MMGIVVFVVGSFVGFIGWCRWIVINEEVVIKNGFNY